MGGMAGPWKPPINGGNVKSGIWAKFIHFLTPFIHVSCLRSGDFAVFHTFLMPTIFFPVGGTKPAFLAARHFCELQGHQYG